MSKQKSGMMFANDERFSAGLKGSSAENRSVASVVSRMADLKEYQHILAISRQTRYIDIIH